MFSRRLRQSAVVQQSRPVDLRYREERRSRADTGREGGHQAEAGVHTRNQVVEDLPKRQRHLSYDAGGVLVGILRLTSMPSFL